MSEKSRTWSLTVIVHSKHGDNSSVSSVSTNHLYCAGGKTKLNQWDTSLYSWMNVITCYAQGFLKKPVSVSFSRLLENYHRYRLFLWLWRIKARCERRQGSGLRSVTSLPPSLDQHCPVVCVCACMQTQSSPPWASQPKLVSHLCC